MVSNNEQNEYRLLFELNPIPVLVFDYKTHKFLAVNEAAVKNYGYSKEEFLNMKIEEIRPEVYIEELNRELKSESRGLVKEKLCKHKKKDGSVIDVEISSHNVTFEGKDARIVIANDITEKLKTDKELEESRSNFKNIIDNANIGIYQATPEGKILTANIALTKMLGYNSRDEFMKLNLKKDVYYNEEDRKNILEKIESNKNLKINIETEWKRKDGTPIIVNINSVAVKNDAGKTLYYEGFVRDITEQKLAEQNLKKSEKKYSKLFHSSNDGIFIHTLEGTIIDVNDKVMQQLGFTREEMIGLKVTQLHPEYVLPIAKSASSKIRRDNFVRFEIDFKRKNGSILPAEISANLFEIEGEKIIQSIVRDISERRSAEEEVKKLAKYPAENPYPVMRTSKNGILLYANNASKILLEDWEAMIGKFLPDFWCNLISEVFVSGKSRGVDVKVNNKIFALTLAPIKDAGYVNLYGLEITERKKVMNALKVAKEKAEEANRLKSGFLKTMSHEIRTPLNAILGISDLLESEFYEKADEDMKGFFHSLKDAGNSLLNTITQILDASRIEANEFKISPQPLSINDSVKSAVDMMQLFADNKEIKIKTELPDKEITVNADSYCLDNVLTNIINNAVKYSNRENIIVKVKEEEDFAVCLVEDKGIGISEEYQKHLFEMFSQEDVGISRPFEGTGLGLALTKRYLELMDGNIFIESSKGIGTSVTIKLPKITQKVLAE